MSSKRTRKMATTACNIACSSKLLQPVAIRTHTAAAGIVRSVDIHATARYSKICRSVCVRLCVCRKVYCGKTAEWIRLTHECLGPPHSPRQTTARSFYAVSHNDATKSPLVTMGRREFTPNCPFPFDDHHQNLIHPYRARPNSSPQTASRFNQPFCHNSHAWTDKWD